MKRISTLLALAIICLIGDISYSQNPAWILSPKYKKGVIQPLPSPGLPNYDGHAAACASNMQLDASRNILFFIVDDGVYNKDGILTAVMKSNFSYPESNIAGNSELAVVQDLRNCGRYYILT